MISLAQMRQFNGCGKGKERWNIQLHLGSDAGSWISIVWLLQDTKIRATSIDSICQNNKIKNCEIKKRIPPSPSNCIVLKKSVYLIENILFPFKSHFGKFEDDGVF